MYVCLCVCAWACLFTFPISYEVCVSKAKFLLKCGAHHPILSHQSTSCRCVTSRVPHNISVILHTAHASLFLSLSLLLSLAHTHTHTCTVVPTSKKCCTHDFSFLNQSNAVHGLRLRNLTVESFTTRYL